ncbi:hypothetical protein Tco_0493363 [Tanacetum coccineum]
MQDMLLGVLSTVLTLFGPTITNSSSFPIECRMTMNSSVLQSSSELSMPKWAGIVIFMDTEYVDSMDIRIGNWSNAFSCEVLAQIRRSRISLVGYGVLVKFQKSSNVFVLAPNHAPFSLSSQNTPELLHLSTLKQLSTK